LHERNDFSVEATVSAAKRQIAGGTPVTTAAFTIIELLVVIAIILVLAGLILSTMGYVQKKSRRARAETEIAAISAACESYKADNGIYPRDPTANIATDTLDARTMGDPSVAVYKAASLVLYRALSGDRNLDRVITAADESLNIDGFALSPPLTQLPESYFAFKLNMLDTTSTTTTDANGNPITSTTVNYIRDPFGNSYGYSTAYQYDVDTGTNPSTHGYNPTFDLWSTAGLTTDPDGTGTDATTQQWIKNW
jgi:type II secretory pathway pseudopilin PulG